MLEEYIKDLIPNDIPCVIGDLPGTASNIVAIKLYDGGSSSEYFMQGSVFNPILKIVARNQNYEEARQWMNDIKDVLHRYHDETLLSVLMSSYPVYLGRGESKLHEFQVVFTIKIRSDE